MRRWTLVGVIAVGVAVFAAYSLVRTARSATIATSAASQERGYVDAAIAEVASRDRGCNALVDGRESQGTPTTLLSILAVLRRPAGRQHQYRQSVLEFAQNAGTVYVNYLRPSKTADGQTYYVVPLITGGRARAPARCIAEQRRALQARLPQIPKSSQSSTLKLAAEIFTRERRVVHPQEVVELLQTARAVRGGGRSAASVCCSTASAIAAGHGAGATSGATLSFIVPDGVATVTLLANSSRRTAITTRPVGNVVVVSVPLSIRTARTYKEIWRSANGTVIKTLTRP